jgi:hypothetical protein
MLHPPINNRVFMRSEASLTAMENEVAGLIQTFAVGLMPRFNPNMQNRRPVTAVGNHALTSRYRGSGEEVSRQ